MPSGKGLVFVFDNNPHSQGNAQWTAKTAHGPNSISMDGPGNSVAVADGTPRTHPPAGAFYVFDAAGGARPAPAPSHKMNYPVQIAAGGGVAVGGCDDGNVFYFDV